MEHYKLWKDKNKGILDPLLFSTKAEYAAKTIAAETDDKGKNINSQSQIRKFYDEVVRLNTMAKVEYNESGQASNWEIVLPMVHMILAKTAYAKGRKLISHNFLDFMKNYIQQISDQKDLEVFANFFEAFMGYYKYFRPKD